MAQQQGKSKRKGRWWLELPVAAGIVAAIAVYTRHYPPLQQGRMLVIVATATVAAMIGLGLVNRAVKPRRQAQPRRRRYSRPAG